MQTVAGKAVHGLSVTRVHGLLALGMGGTVFVFVAGLAEVDGVVGKKKRTVAAMGGMAIRAVDNFGMSPEPARLA